MKGREYRGGLWPSALHQEPWLNNGELDWREGASASLDAQVIATIDKPFSLTAAPKC